MESNILKPLDIAKKASEVPNELIEKVNELILKRIGMDSCEYEFRLSCESLKIMLGIDYSLYMYYSWFIQLKKLFEQAGWKVEFTKNHNVRYDDKWQDCLIVNAPTYNI